MQIPDLTAKRAQLSGDKTALVDMPSGRAFTYADLDDRASRIAEFLRDDWGIKPGDRIATLAQNRTEVVELLFACAKVRAILVPLNWRLAVPELQYILADADAVGLINDEMHAATATALRNSVAGANGSLRSMALGADVLDCETSYDRACHEASGKPITHPPRDEAEAWYLMYTSGTTGKPKGVLQTPGMTLVNYLNIGIAAGLTSDDTFLSVLPQFHTGGWNLYLLPTLLVGGTVVLPRTFDPGDCLRYLEHDASVFFGVPTNYQMLADHPDFPSVDLSGVRSWSSGGAAMPVPLLRTLAESGVQVRQGMGMTETGPTVFLLDAERAISKAGSIGMPQGFVETKIVDSKGHDVPRGERGELLIRGPGVTPGYWRMPEATDAAFTEDGWLRSGDIARQDEDGDYYIVDRAKDMYISGGENVYPAEVEAVIIQFPDVKDAAVIGVRDETWGEVGIAFVQLRSGQDLDVGALRAFCREKLAKYKMPRSVEVVEELPRNSSGKIQKHILAEQRVGQ